MAKLFVTLIVFCVFGSVLVHELLKNKDFVIKTAECAMETGYLASTNKNRALRCSYACLMKKYYLMDANGKIIKETAIFLAYETLGEKAAETVKMIGICSKMNVSKDHCEAAVEYMACAGLQQMPQLIDNALHI